jgi:hypothetical protein
VNVDELVTVHLSSPREKFWGVLLAMSPAGATVRGVSLETFEDWLRRAARGEPALPGATTVFFPARRLDRVEVDESTGVVESLGDRFRRLAGRDPRPGLLAVQGDRGPGVEGSG